MAGMPTAGPAEAASRPRCLRRPGLQVTRPGRLAVMGYRRPAMAGTPFRNASLAAQAKALDQLPVALLILLLQIVQQPAPLADHHQQAAAGMEILLVRLEMIGQVLDALGQQRHLNLRRTRIAFGG